MMPGNETLSRTVTILRANTREAVGSLRRARLRTLLGLVGIMIGISSVITMVSLGEIAKEQARKRFEVLGTDILVIRKSYEVTGPRQQEATIRLPDALALAVETPSITVAAPRIIGHGEFRHAGKDVGNGSVQGVTAPFADVNKLSLQEGRFISNLDIDRYYCVVGAELAGKIREGGVERLMGETLEIDEDLFTIVGVLNDAAENYALPVQVDANKSVFVPITTSARIAANPQLEAIIARSAAGVHYTQAVQDVRSFFRGRSLHLRLDVITAKELIARMEEQMRIMTLLLGAVGSISLIVGGIGIMNIMLVSVSERRREIAIRRALGARLRDIQSQFLIESVLMTVMGGLLGIVLGLVATWAICQFTNWEFLISVTSVLSGLGTAAAAGVFFGFQPAHQASRLDPIEGLQEN